MDRYPPKGPEATVRGPPPPRPGAAAASSVVGERHLPASPAPARSTPPVGAPPAPPSPTPPAAPGTAGPAPAPSAGAGRGTATGVSAAGSPASPRAAAPPSALITLERPFDPDEFSRHLGENAVRMTVPRDSLTEVLTRISQFMSFGIYVYAFSVRPAAGEMLNGFEIELERVDYTPGIGWRPFQDRGRADSPFGPAGRGGGSAAPEG